MPIKSFKPITPSLRFKTVSTFEEITRDKPERSLIVPLKKTGGRNNHGRITCRHRGGGHKRAYRIIDFKRNKFDIPAKVTSIEYDPNRSARIALLAYADGEKRYILAPIGLSVSDSVISSEKAEIRVGNTLPLRNIPLGSTVHNIELKIGKGGQIARSAGSYAQLVAKEGRRPKVRGVAMNPIDHPMGGGEGKASGGRHPCSPWGLLSKGKKTRRKKSSDSLIVKKRKSK